MTTATLSPSRARVKFRLGGGASAKLEDVDVGLVDLSHIGKTIGAKLDGIVGYNLLRNYKVALDYPNETLSLFTP